MGSTQKSTSPRVTPPCSERSTAARADKSSLYDIDRSWGGDSVASTREHCGTKRHLGANVMRMSFGRRHTLEEPEPSDEVTIRRAYPDDHGALVRLAALDCRRL